jgi:hypothetical protein
VRDTTPAVRSNPVSGEWVPDGQAPGVTPGPGGTLITVNKAAEAPYSAHALLK